MIFNNETSDMNRKDETRDGILQQLKERAWRKIVLGLNFSSATFQLSSLGEFPKIVKTPISL